jgi:alkanesulfonate monooxygenase SsuD/methylene tetrahydromethanopterin reductase-like flavin-dependent oxidoreductase (luciferase family)
VTDLWLGTLVSPVTFRHPGVLAKSLATLDVLTGGRAFAGVGAGWWEREHAAYGLPFPQPRERLDEVERAIETMRALWGTGTKPYAGRRVSLPETTCYPRPVGKLPIILGGNGSRTMRIAARYADAVNLPSDEATLSAKLGELHTACAAAERDPTTLAITVLDVTVIGDDREDVARRVERLRGRTSAAAYARRHHAGTLDDQRRRRDRLASLGVGTVFLALPDLFQADDVDFLSALLDD